MPSSTTPHLTEHQLAERQGRPVKTLQAERLKGGGVPFLKFGRTVRYRLEDVLAWEQAHLFNTTTEATLAKLSDTGVNNA